MHIIIALLFLLLATPAFANHQEFSWDANIEPDLKEYRLYTCPALPCTKLEGVLYSVTPMTKLPITHGTEGDAFVTAIDTSDNESVESNVVVYDAVPPFGPKNLKAQRK